MTIADRIPGLGDDELASLLANARRLQEEGGARAAKAEVLIPLVEAELTERAASRPASVRKAPGPKARRGKS